jgi:hypothetical protein
MIKNLVLATYKNLKRIQQEKKMGYENHNPLSIFIN